VALEVVIVEAVLVSSATASIHSGRAEAYARSKDETSRFVLTGPIRIPDPGTRQQRIPLLVSHEMKYCRRPENMLLLCTVLYCTLCENCPKYGLPKQHSLLGTKSGALLQGCSCNYPSLQLQGKVH
jgi:hypothetical protein